MFHYFNALQLKTGLAGYFCRLIDPTTGGIVTMSADTSGTPIATVSGVANMAIADAAGNFSFYVDPGTYHQDIYGTDATTFIVRIPSVPMGTGTAGAREEVSPKDYSAKGDTVLDASGAYVSGTDDTAAIMAAVATGKDVFLPRGTYRATSPIALRSGQTIYGEKGATIFANFNGFIFTTVGSTGSIISSVSGAIAALAMSFTVASAAGLAAGDNIILYDVVADQYEVNRIQAISGTTIYCTWRITQPFATAANIRLYKMASVKDAGIRGLTLTNVHASGGLVSFTYSEDCFVEDCRLGPCGYIGATFQSSIAPRFVGNIVSNTGASAIGLRVTKAGAIEHNRFFNILGDEAISLYRNNSHTTIHGNRIAQYLSGQGSSAGNNILLDQRNYFNTITGNTCEGSATYSISLNDNGSFNVVTHNTLGRANLGAIKVAVNSNGNTIDNNTCSQITDATDAFESGGATAVIRVKSDCSGNFVGPGNIMSTYAGLGLVDAQTAPAPAYMRNLVANVPTSVPSLAVNSDMTFALTSNTNLRVAVRGSDGTTRVANLTLA